MHVCVHDYIWRHLCVCVGGVCMDLSTCVGASNQNDGTLSKGSGHPGLLSDQIKPMVAIKAPGRWA